MEMYSGGPYTELSKLEIARRHVTHLARFKHLKNPSKCQVFGYTKN